MEWPLEKWDPLAVTGWLGFEGMPLSDSPPWCSLGGARRLRGRRDQHQITRSVAGCGRLAAASVPTGRNQLRGQDSIAWLREQQYLSREVEAGSATAWTL